MGAIRRHPIWCDATERGLRRLLSISETTMLRSGENALVAGQPAERIHLLLEGAMRVFYPAKEEDAEVTVKLFWAPAAFGDAESVMKTRWSVTVQALTPCTLLMTRAAQYFALMQEEPTVCFRQYWDVARRFAVAIKTERAANFDELRDRVIALLVAYAHHFGERGERGVVIEAALSQEGIARQVSSNRRSIVRVLGDLYDRRLIERSGRRFRIPDVDALLGSSRAESPALSFSTDPQPWGVRRSSSTRGL
jgi:CRP-like cAMP-binding protein